MNLKAMKETVHTLEIGKTLEVNYTYNWEPRTWEHPGSLEIEIQSVFIYDPFLVSQVNVVDKIDSMDLARIEYTVADHIREVELTKREDQDE